MKEHITEQCALITGASAGIGKALAHECAKRRMNLALVSLAGTGLVGLAKQIEEEYSVKVVYLEIDLTEKNAPEDVFEWCADLGLGVNVIINNAGIGAAGSFANESVEDIDYMLHLNIRSLVILTRLFIPELKKHKQAYILNMSSIGGLIPTAYKAVYCATKTFIFYFSRAIREELRKTNVKVTVLLPAAIPTNKHVIERIENGGVIAKLTAMPAEQLARIAIDKLLNGRVVVIPGFLTNLFRFFGTLIPLQLRIRMLGNVIKKGHQ